MARQDEAVKIALALGGIWLFSRYSTGVAQAASTPQGASYPTSSGGTSQLIQQAVQAAGSTIKQLPSSTTTAVTSDVVAWVQQSLNFLLDASISVDGVFGPQTQSLITSYQGIKGLYATGRIDQPLIDALNADLASSESLSWGRYPTLTQFMDPNWQPTDIFA